MVTSATLKYQFLVSIGIYLWQVYRLVSLVPLSLAISPWVGTMSAGSCFSHRWWKNGNFSVL